MAADSIRLFNAALSRHGANLITGTNSTEPNTQLADLNYEQIVGAELQSAPWRFARQTALCTDTGDAPEDSDFLYAMTLPATWLTLRTVIKNGQPISYQIDKNGVVLTNENENVYAVFTYRAPETAFPPDFTEGLICRFEAIYLRSKKRYEEAEARDKAAEGKFARARLTHAQEEYPKDPLRNSSLLAARRLGSTPNRG